MALFNYATKEITLKIVYYGPGLSGKTTNIQYLHSALKAENKGKLLSLSTEADRTLFFDFLPIELGKIKEFSVRFQLYTVPGQVRYNATRKVVLKGADAVVFVADSQRDMKEQNIESLENMLENLTSNNINPEEISVVLQYNKRDLTNIMSIAELNSDINKDDAFNIIEAEAITGKGVEDTFRLITRLVLKDIARKHKIEIQPVPVKEEVKEEIGEAQKPEPEFLQLESEDELVEPSGYALEEELEELAEPKYILEEEMEAIPTVDIIQPEKGPDLKTELPAIAIIEPGKERDLKTEYPIEKEVYTNESVDIWEARGAAAVLPIAEEIESEKGPDLKKAYPIEKEVYAPEAIDIWGPKAPEVSMEETPTVKKIGPEKGPDLKAAYPIEKEVYAPEAIDIWGPKAPEVSMEEKPPVKKIGPEKGPDLKKAYPIERDVYTREALDIGAKVVPAVSAENLKINAADISELKASISDLKAVVASLKADVLDIKDSLRKAEEKSGVGEDKNIKEMRRDQREMRNILRDIAVAISELKVKKSWFRF